MSKEDTPSNSTKIKDETRNRFIDLVQVIKSTPLSQHLAQNTYVDVFDNYNSWRNGFVLEMLKNDEIKIRFDGWSNKYDETHKTTSQKVALFRSHADPYTGASRQAVRDFKFDRVVDRINRAIEKMSQISIKEFQDQKPSEICQFLRGELYFLLDNVLQEAEPFRDDEIKTSLDFIESFLRFIVKWLEYLTTSNVIVDFIDGKNAHTDMYYYDVNVGVVNCYPEFFDIMLSIFFGNQPRTRKFFQNNELFLVKTQTSDLNDTTYAERNNPKDKSISCVAILGLITYFGKNKGFDKLADLLSWKYVEGDRVVHRIPFIMIKSALPLIQAMSQFMNSSFKDEYLNKIKNIIFERLQNLTTNDLKDSQIKNLFVVLKQVPKSLNYLPKINQDSEQLEVRLALTFIQSGILEKKIRGVKELTDLIDKTTKTFLYNSRQDDYRTSHFTETTLAQFFADEKVFDIIMNEASNPEVFKRAIPVLKYMTEQNGMTQEQLEQLWQAQQNKHENQIKAVLDVIAELSKVLPVDTLDYIYEKILKVPVEQYDSQFLLFLKDFTLNASLNIQGQLNKSSKMFSKQKPLSVKYEFYGVNLLWELIQDSSQLSPSLMTSGTMAFINCIKGAAIKIERERYIGRCIDNLNRGVSVPQSLLVAQHALESFGTGQSWRGDATEDQLNKILKENILIDQVVNDLVKYVRRHQGTQVTDPSSQILSGKIAHDLNIRYRLEFIEYVNSILPRKLELNAENFGKLWNALVLKPLHESDSQHLLDMVSKSTQNVRSTLQLLRESQTEDIFRSIFCNIQLMSSLTPSIYKTIEKYFFFTNTKNQSLQQVKTNIKVSKFDNIVGLEFFWVVVQYCQREDILTQARQTLVNIHLRTEKVSNVEQRLAMWQQFLTRSQQILRSSQIDAVGKGNVIRSLKLLITGVEGKTYLNSTEPAKSMVKFTVQIGKNEQTQKTLQMPSNCTLLEMRKNINKEFNIGIQDYELYFANYDVRLPPESEEDYPVSQLEENREREKVDVIIEKLSNSSFPGLSAVNKFKAHLAGNWDIAEILFDLLQNANESYFEDIWEVLKLLPQNKLIKSQIEKLTADGSEESWNKILYFSCSRKLLYCLQIVETVIAERKGKEKWMLEFLKNKGLYHVINYYVSQSENQLSVIFNLKCFSSLAKVIKTFIDSHIQQYPQFFDSSPEKLLRTLSLKSLEFLLTFFNLGENKENRQQKETQTIQEFIQYLMELIGSAMFYFPSVNANIQKSDLTPGLIKKGLIDLQDQQARKQLQVQLLKLCNNRQFSSYLLNIVNNLFSKELILALKDQVNEFLQLLGELIVLERNAPISLVQQIIDVILESNSNEYESVLGQCFLVLKGAASISAEAKQLITGSQYLADCLINDCLFRLPKLEGNNIIVAKCQSQEARKEGYQLAVQMIPGSLSTLLQILEQYVQEAFWRTNSFQDWNIMQVSQQKSRTEFVGLKNLGCICYMNSLMQQLYTLPHFRDSILQVQLEPKPSSVLYQFQLLLSSLRSSQKPYYDPRPICNVLGQNGGPINVMEQMDVDEFWSGFMDKLETELKPLRKNLLIERNFGGKLSSELICKGCPHQSSREELFLSLPLQVKNKKNIIESLNTMIEGEMLEGDNAYFCEKCEKKIPTLMRLCVKKLPNVLLLVLKRFEFNFETLTKFKLNDSCEFPMKLNMRPYTKEYLKAQEMKQDQDDENSEPMDMPEYPPEYYEYQLRGVIIHMGTADSGHYYSLIKDGNTSNWFEFNDTIVKPFDINDLATEAFGNDDKRSTSGQSYGGMAKDRSRNAYMVFYERVEYVDDNGKPLKNENELNWYFNKAGEDDVNRNGDNAQWFNQELLQDSIKFQVNKVMFEKSFFDFSYNLLQYAEENPSSTHATQIGKYCVQFFMTVVIRANERKDLPKFIIPLKKLIKRNVQVSKAIVEAFCNKEIVNEFLIQCPVTDMKYIVAGIVASAINCVAQHQDKTMTYQQFKSESPNAKLIVAFLIYFWEFRTESRKCEQFFRVLHSLCVSSVNAKFYMLRHKSIGRILLYLLEEPPEGAGYQQLKVPSDENTLPILKTFKKSETTTMNQSQVTVSTQVTNSKQQPVVQNNMWDINTHNYTYLVETLSELFYGLSINKGSENGRIVNQQSSYLHDLDDDELALLEDPQITSRLLSISYTRKARRALSNFMQLLVKTHLDKHSSFNPWQTTERLVTSVYHHLKDCEERELKAGLTCLNQIALVKDAYEDQRCTIVAEVLILTLKDGLNLWIYTEIVLDYIFKVCSQNLKLMMSIRQVLLNNKSVLKLIENWIKESSNPYNHFNQQRWKIFKKRNPSITSNEITQNIKIFQNKATYRNELLFKKIMKGESPEINSYDSDEELNITQLEKRSLIDAIYPVRQSHQLCYDFSGYQTWEIMENIDDMVELRALPDDSGKQTSTLCRWLHFDDDSFAPPQQGVIRYKQNVNFFK